MRILTICVLFLTFVAGNAIAGKPGSCSDVPISFTFVAPAGVQAAIWNDDPTKVYTGGTNTEIHNCNGGANGGGSYDGTMTLPGSRYINIKFPAAISGSLIEGGPTSFAAGNSITTTPFVKIHNLTGQNAVPAGISATYYARALFLLTDRIGKLTAWNILRTIPHVLLTILALLNFTAAVVQPSETNRCRHHG